QQGQHWHICEERRIGSLDVRNRRGILSMLVRGFWIQSLDGTDRKNRTGVDLPAGVSFERWLVVSNTVGGTCSLLMRHPRSFALGLFHEEKQRQQEQKQDAEEAEHVVVGKHGRVSLQHSPEGSLCLVFGSYGVRASRDKHLPHAGQHLPGARAGVIH